jgi:hypothetical protein
MPTNNQNKDIYIQRPYSGLHTDNSPVDQPEGTYRFLLNGITQTVQGDRNFVSNEESNVQVATLNSGNGYKVIGHLYIGERGIIVWSTNLNDSSSEIGLLDSSDTYTVLVNTPNGSNNLGFSQDYPIDATYRVRRGNEIVVYWVDGLHNARQFNIDKQQNYYTSAYKVWLSGTRSPAFSGVKWNIQSFELIKTYTRVPFFESISEQDGGTIKSGSYNFAIQYLDEDLNPTNWITVSGVTKIYNDNSQNTFSNIRGSRYITNDAQNFRETNKALKINVGNLDNNFPYYRIAIIQAISGDGFPTKVYGSDPISINSSSYIYRGNDAQLIQIPLADISIDKNIILAPKHIEQLENRLILANAQDTKYNWCNYQQYASQIKTSLTTRTEIVNSQYDSANIKNLNSGFLFIEYMPGEAYSLGIQYLMKDMSLSPSFHIPGSPDNTTGMELYECDNAYADIYSCNGANNFWGNDWQGNPLSGKKIRQHKFPYRDNSTNPLIQNAGTVNINKYNISLTVTLNSGHTFPVDGAGRPLVINATFRYKPSNSPNIFTTDVQITQDVMGNAILIYDDIDDLVTYFSGAYIQLDPDCELAQYQTPILGSDTFVITIGSKNTVTVATVNNAVSSNLYGLKFDNIIAPPDAIGFYITRIERTDNDKLVLDNGISGMMTRNIIGGGSTEYHVFNQFYPEFYPFIYLSDKPSGYTQNMVESTIGAYLWYPEFAYNNKRLQPKNLKIQAYYKYGATTYQSATNAAILASGSGSWSTGYRNGIQALLTLTGVGDLGTYVPKIQVGSTYQASNGVPYDMFIGWKSSVLGYAYDPSMTDLPDFTKLIYLDAASSITDAGNVYYNASGDNKIGIIQYTSPLPAFLYYDPDGSRSSSAADDSQLGRVLIVTLESGLTNAYSNFANRTYYREHANPVMFNGTSTLNGIKVFGGDTYISCTNLTSSCFSDTQIGSPANRAAATKAFWELVAGVVLLVAAVVVNVVPGVGQAISAELGATALTVLTSMAIAAGVSLVQAGIKNENLQQMINVDYNNGLHDAIKDTGLAMTCSFSSLNSDTIRWFSGILNNIYIESQVPLGLRAGITATGSDFVNAPSGINSISSVLGAFGANAFDNYLTEKFTALDSESISTGGSGRLYRGYPMAEFYDCNLDYYRRQKEKQYYFLPIGYNCCNPENQFPTRVFWSEQSFQEELSDNYFIFLPNNYKDVEGERGEITDLFRIKANLYVHCRRGLWHLPRVYQERATDDVISFLGTGEFFSVPPVLVKQDTIANAGTNSKWGTIRAKDGVVFIAENERAIYLFDGEQLVNLTSPQFGNATFFKNNIPYTLVNELRALIGIEYPFTNNPFSTHGIGFTATYDNRYNRIIITKKDYKLANAYIDQGGSIPFISFHGNSGFPTMAKHQVGYNLDNNLFYIQTGSDTSTIDLIDFEDLDYVLPSLPNTPTIFENHSWTMSFDLDNNKWIGFHSYLPNTYLFSPEGFYSVNQGSSKNGINTRFLKHNIISYNNTAQGYCKYDNVVYPFILELVNVNNPLETRIWDDVSIELIAKLFDPSGLNFRDINDLFFNKVMFYNSRQNSGEQVIIIKDDMADSTYMLQQTLNPVGNIYTTRKERNWNLNDIRDYIIDYTKPMFSSYWTDIYTNYFIDKVINDNTIVNPNPLISFTKDWTQLESMMDKFLIMRFKLDNTTSPYFNNVNLVINYSKDLSKESYR